MNHSTITDNGTLVSLDDPKKRIAKLEKLLQKAADCLKDAHMEKRLRSDINAAITEGESWWAP